MSNNKEVLIIHGWMNSSIMYNRVKNDLKDKANVTTIDLPGFGGTKTLYKFDLIDSYVEYVHNILITKEFDVVVCHSMACLIILKLLSKYDNFKFDIVLFNPACKCKKYLEYSFLLLPIIYVLFKMKDTLPVFITKPFIKLFALVSVNDYNKINDELITSIINTDTCTAIVLLYELTHSKFTVNKKLYNKCLIVISEKDRIVENREIIKLKSSLVNSNIIELNSVGHTVVLEDYYSFIRIVSMIIQ